MKRISFIIISIVAIGLFLIRIKPKINSFVSAFDKDGYVTFSGNGMNFLFDTGANIRQSSYCRGVFNGNISMGL